MTDHKKNAILIVSFGTTYPKTREKNISAIRRLVGNVYPDWTVTEAFSSKIVRAAMKKNEGIEAWSPQEALAHLKEQGYAHVAVLPTHIIDGIENHNLKLAVEEHRTDFVQIEVADALLGKPQDYVDVANALWISLKDEVGDAPLVLMGHGTEHMADSSYAIMENALRACASHPIYIATVEGRITIEDVIRRMKEELNQVDEKQYESVGTDGKPESDCRNETDQGADRKYKRVVVTPFMLVAGDHANHDMAGESASFYSKLKEAGYEPECIIRGIGEYPAVRDVYLAHLRDVMERFEEELSQQTGALYGIGVGPGEPELITIKAIQTVRTCDVIVLPAVSKEECYAYRIVHEVCPEVEEKSLLCMPFPMIKDAQKLELAHEKSYQAIADYLKRGRKVGMLTIGDPSVYSTYMYMHHRAVDAGWEAYMISGVPSFCAAAGRLGISLGEKSEEIHIIPASYDVRKTYQYDGTCIYMKSGKRLAELLKALREQQDAGRNIQVYGVTNCGMENERVYRGIDELESAEGYLTTVITKVSFFEEN